MFHISDLEEAVIVPNSQAEVSMMGRFIDQHGKKLEEHEERFDDHEIRLRVQEEHIKQLQDNAIKLENVVMTENRDTRATITETNKQLHELINGLMGYKTGESQMSNALKMARFESIAKIIGILSGSGGLLYVLLTKL